MNILGWTLWFVITHTVTGRFALKTPKMQSPCNSSFPLTMPAWLNQDLPAPNLRRLAHCFQEFHGCSDDLISCGADVNLVTCSCAHNCKTYGDCCWNVSFPSTPGAQMSRASCIEVQASPTKKIQVNMVTGCPATWPNDYVRHACEGPESFADTFYVIPATSLGGVTYR
ncbi:hypothetical protein MTO96_018384 [Rhipicephalus appendiculatus]